MNTRALLTLGIIVLLAGCGGGGGSAPTQPPPSTGNHNPALSVNASTTHLAYGGGASISVTASDPDGDQLTFSYTATGGSVSASGPTATTAAFTAGSQWGPASVTVTVSDGRGGSAQATAAMYVQNPSPPILCFGLGSSSAKDLTVTPAEAIVVTSVAAQNLYDGNCFASQNFLPAGTAVGAHETREFGVSLVCSSSPNASISDWAVDVSGWRAEPDGGAFHVHFNYGPNGIVQPQCSH
jgi:hypothetical protein